MALPVVAAIFASLTPILVPLAIRLLAGLGFAAITYTGISILLDSLITNLWASMGQASAGVVALLTIGRVDDALTVIISAITAKLALRGLTAAGVFKKVHWIGGGAPVVLN